MYSSMLKVHARSAAVRPRLPVHHPPYPPPGREPGSEFCGSAIFWVTTGQRWLRDPVVLPA